MLLSQPAVRQEFSATFHRFWHVDPGPQLLAALRSSTCQHCSVVRGWTKGGCLVAARGIENYIARSVHEEPGVSLVAVATDETEAAHVLVALDQDGEERFLDAAGIWTRKALLVRLSEEYQYDAYELVSWQALALDRVRIPFDGRIAQLVTEALLLAFGQFSPNWIFNAHPHAS